MRLRANFNWLTMEYSGRAWEHVNGPCEFTEGGERMQLSDAQLFKKGPVVSSNTRLHFDTGA